jgi:predicted transposase/invertase (TIGR01784 family)
MSESRREGREEGIKEGIEEGIKEGIEEGIKEGIRKGKEEDAIRALNINLPIEQIELITGLPQSEILKLKQELIK